MVALSVPSSGLILGAVPDATGTGKSAVHGNQVMRISFADSSVLNEALKHSADLKFVFGKSARLVYGDESMEILATGQEIRHELYQTAQGGQLDFIGLFTHNLEVREVNENSVDESLLKLQENYARIKDEKAANTTMVVDSSELPPARPARRSAPLKNTLPARRGVSSRKFEPSRSVSSTPSGPPSRSPAGVETSTTSSNLNAKLDGLRIPLIHLLALGSASEHSLATKTKATEEMCLRILQRIANRVKAGRQWELMDDHFKDLDVWGFPYEEGDRNTAVFNCRAAFNRLRLPREAPEWQTLLQPEDRGKVDPNPLPVKSSKTVASDVPSLSLHIPLDIKMPSEGAQTPGSKGTKKKDTKDPISHIIKKKGKKVTAPGKPKGPTGRQPKPLQKQSVSNPKIKSAEKVLDSDEDVEMEDVKLSPPKLEHAPVSPGHPIACSKTSYIVNSDAELDKKAHNAKISTKKKPRYLPTPKPNSYVKVPSKEACRRSVSVSPPKPSPLGSSPPINASDVEEQSNVPSPRVPTPYAGNSTASQSPSDSLAGIIRTTKSSKNGVKRKVTVVREPDELSDYRSSVSSTASNKRQNTGSPDDATLLLARQFKEEFREYERLYNEARATEDSLRKQERIENVLKIHRDLERLKAAVQARTPVHVR